MVQTFWAQRNLSTQDLLDVMTSSSDGSNDLLSRVPAVVRTEMLFPYIDGLSFVRQAYKASGNSFAGVDDLFVTPPESTAQILHPQKYRDHVHPEDVQLPALAERLGQQWRHVGDGTLGELDTRVLLEQYGDRLEAAHVASAWSGDRWQLLEKDAHSAIVLKWTWTTEADAANFFSAYGRALRTRFPNAVTDEASSSRQALTTPIYATDLRVQGRQVIAVIAFDRDAATAITNAL